MKTITVIKKFVLTLQDHTTRVFEKGVHEIEDEIAGHWFVGAHTTVAASVNAVDTDVDALKAKAEAEALAAAQKTEADAEALAKVADDAAAKARAEADALVAAAAAANKKSK
jgi:hypothetical protein